MGPSPYGYQNTSQVNGLQGHYHNQNTNLYTEKKSRGYAIDFYSKLASSMELEQSSN